MSDTETVVRLDEATAGQIAAFGTAIAETVSAAAVNAYFGLYLTSPEAFYGSYGAAYEAWQGGVDTWSSQLPS